MDILEEQESDPTQELSAFRKAFSGKNFVICILMAGNIVSGFGQAMVFVAQGEYIAYYSTGNT